MPGPVRHELFYAPPDAISGGRIRFPEDESAHIVSSLRLTRGDGIAVTDGAGRLMEAELEVADRGLAVARVRSTEEIQPPAVALTLFQGIIRPQRMDLVVEKCVELGVTAIVPVVTERSIERDAASRLTRWKRIAVEAMKQSQRVYLAEIRGAVTFEDALGEAAGFDRVLVARRHGAPVPPPPDDLVVGQGSMGLFVGPEGGFSEDEFASLTRGGARPLHLGDARLRSETAAIAAVAVIGRFLQ